MQIETKFSLDDKLFFMFDNEVRNHYVDKINIDIKLIKSKDRYNKTTFSTDIEYRLNKNFNVKEDKLYRTKEELLKSL